ncbi:hypothetical protein MG293_003884 [Ovis ammon polii]|uniref:Uncharacterized protein n=1 Tax=Ovis ammon polii TaxID=230172 RepID=A0AAD4YGI9_OVIAM|nr:hypothetical protein MG293_003884 [Ovis ammon polii]
MERGLWRNELKQQVQWRTWDSTSIHLPYFANTTFCKSHASKALGSALKFFWILQGGDVRAGQESKWKLMTEADINQLHRYKCTKQQQLKHRFHSQATLGYDLVYKRSVFASFNAHLQQIQHEQGGFQTNGRKEESAKHPLQSVQWSTSKTTWRMARNGKGTEGEKEEEMKAASTAFKILGIMTIDEHISNEEILVLREQSGFAFGNTVL